MVIEGGKAVLFINGLRIVFEVGELAAIMRQLLIADRSHIDDSDVTDLILTIESIKQKKFSVANLEPKTLKEEFAFENFREELRRHRGGKL